MIFLSGGRPQIRLIALMVGIAVIGLVLGAVAWSWRSGPRIAALRRAASAQRASAQHWRQVAGWIDNPCLRAKRYANGPGVLYEYNGDHYDQRYPYIYELDLDMYPQAEEQREFIRRHRDEILALCRERVAYHERLRDWCSFAVWAPWSDPPKEPAPPIIETRHTANSY